ncbi:phage tail assembly chaperone [Novosphingobium colocasiae]
MTVLADQALALCGLAARVLLWRPDEFWNATPAELAAALGMNGGAEAAPPHSTARRWRGFSAMTGQGNEHERRNRQPADRCAGEHRWFLRGISRRCARRWMAG